MLLRTQRVRSDTLRCIGIYNMVEHQIEWPRLFDMDGAPRAARAKKIDGRLVGPLIALPVALTGATEVEEFHSPAVRDLERGQGVGLPSGEAVARRMGEPPLSAEEVGTSSAGWSGETRRRRRSPIC